MPEIPADESWAVTEWADADLGDARRTQRLVELATVLAQRPSASLPEACGSRAQLKAVYRFFDNDAIDPARHPGQPCGGDHRPAGRRATGPGRAGYHRAGLDGAPGHHRLGAPGPPGPSRLACPYDAGPDAGARAGGRAGPARVGAGALTPSANARRASAAPSRRRKARSG